MYWPLSLAERAGFEPAWAFSPQGFRDLAVKPLRHLSKACCYPTAFIAQKYYNAFSKVFALSFDRATSTKNTMSKASNSFISNQPINYHSSINPNTSNPCLIISDLSLIFNGLVPFLITSSMNPALVGELSVCRVYLFHKVSRS